MTTNNPEMIVVNRTYIVQVPNDLVLLESYLEEEDNQEYLAGLLAEDLTPEEKDAKLKAAIADWLTYEYDTGDDAGLVEISDVSFS